jgi:hypothetical protein
MLLLNRPTDAAVLRLFYGFSHIWHPNKNLLMKLKLWLLLLCLLGIGMFSNAQNKKKESRPTVLPGNEMPPVSVTSSKKYRKPPPPPPLLGRDGKPLPPPKVEMVRFAAPVLKSEDMKVKMPPPPAPPKEKLKADKPVKPNAPPPADFRG